MSLYLLSTNWRRSADFKRLKNTIIGFLSSSSEYIMLNPCKAEPKQVVSPTMSTRNPSLYIEAKMYTHSKPSNPLGWAIYPDSSSIGNDSKPSLNKSITFISTKLRKFINFSRCFFERA